MPSRFYQKYTSVALIFLLFLSQTVQVSFFDRTSAQTTDYRDIVSIVVDEDTYGSLGSKIKTYSEDIQKYLGSTRVSVLVVPQDASPESIATKNEHLYYDGDGKKGVSALVGTILIGNVPVPVVSKDGTSFPSLYPYVDFDDKRFIFDSTTHTYVFAKNAPTSSDVDIWHGLINPALGRSWTGEDDIKKIGKFLDKTHEFYEKKGKFTPSSIPPRVFYYDGYNESAAVSPRALYQYGLYIQNSQNLVYNRLTKYLLSDINDALKAYDATVSPGDDMSTPGLDAVKNADPDLAKLSGGDTLTPDMLATVSDIQSQKVIDSFIKRFHEIINTKTLSDERLFVHNAGRYNSGANVNVDQGAVDMSLLDETSLEIIKGTNDAIEKAILATLQEGNYAKKIPILDTYQNYKKDTTYPRNNSDDIYNSTEESNKVYQNYFLGSKSTTLTDPKQCTIARGSPMDDNQMGRGVLVEANTSFDINATQGDAELLGADTKELVALHASQAFSCFSDTGIPKLDSYWKKNSFLAASTDPTGAGDPTHILFDPLGGNGSFSGMSLPVFSLGGMKESSRVTSPSLANCLDGSYQYTLLQPYTFSYSRSDYNFRGSSSYQCDSAWPKEWTKSTGWHGYQCDQRTTQTPRYSCLTEHIPGPQSTTLKFSDRIGDYSGKSCFSGDMLLDGKIIKSVQSPCMVNQEGYTNWNRGIFGNDGSDGTPSYGTRDDTVYQNISYHTIPSFLEHISPTSEELDAATKNGITPNIPVDIVRSVEFLSPKGNIVSFTYPNFFKAPGNTIAELRSYLKNLSDTEWKRAIDAENAITLRPAELEANTILGAGTLPASPIDWNTLVSDEVLTRVLQARHWNHPNVSEKYKKLVVSNLSYSHTLGGDTAYDLPQIPGSRDGYEIAYLGLTDFIPTASDTVGGTRNTTDEKYIEQMVTLDAINIAEADKKIDDPYKESTVCGDPAGVDIWKWPAAIVCWIKTVKDIKIQAGSCGGDTIGMQKSDTPHISIPASVVKDAAQMRSFLDTTSLTTSLPRTVIRPFESITVSMDLTKDGGHIEMSQDAQISLKVISLTSDGKTIDPADVSNYIQIAPSVQPYGDEKTNFVVTAGAHTLSAKLQSVFSTKLSDGTSYTASKDITLRVSDEYIDVTPMVDGAARNFIDTSLTSPVTLALSVKTASNASSVPSFPAQLSIYDDISGKLLVGNIPLNNSDYQIGTDYTKIIGVYRLVVQDAQGRYGESTLAVRSGPLAQSHFFPLSDTIVKGIDSYGMIQLLDAKSNLISPELHTVTLEAKGGYLIDSLGAHQTQIRIDTIDSELPIAFGSEKSGNLTISYTIDGIASTEKTIQVIDAARIAVFRTGKPTVGGADTSVHIEIQDMAGNLLSGFHSSISLSLPEGAGVFASSSIAIENGKTADITFSPGRVAGSHALTAYVPGIGQVQDLPFIVSAGDPFLVRAHIMDTSVTFTIQDRYSNTVSKDMSGTVKKDADTPMTLAFVGGVATMPRVSGYYSVDVPDLKNTQISYTDSDGAHTLGGISSVSLFIPPVREKFVFRPDYNARYTVLAGDSFLREGENILFDTTPGQSQSLAATTLLSSPYQTDDLFTIFPGGGYLLGTPSDMQISATTELDTAHNKLILSATDAVTRSQIARVAYSLQALIPSSCQMTTLESRDCDNLPDGPNIRFLTIPGSAYTTQTTGHTTILTDGGTPAVRYTSAGLSVSAGVSLVPVTDRSASLLTLDVLSGGTKIGRLLISTPVSRGVQKGSDLTLPSYALILDANHPYLEKPSYHQVFDAVQTGYTITRDESASRIDARLIGPRSVDSLGSLSETPGVGWKDKNRMLLSYAGGDTVGEATRWAHEYMSVNLGDPVAHIERGAPGTENEGIDRSIGTQIASGTHGSIASYAHHDMNKDGLDDIIVTYSDGFFELYLNMSGRFRKRQMIGYLPELVDRDIGFGDFQGDGYSDIIGVDTRGHLTLIDNTERRLTQKVITLTDPTLAIPEHITQHQIYDMDADKRDDIVYVTEGGELGVLYGTAISGIFERKILSNALGVSLSADPTVGGGAIRANTVGDTIPTSSDPNNDESMIWSDVYYRAPVASVSDRSQIPLSPDTAIENISQALPSITPDSPYPETTSQTPSELFVHSEYAKVFGLDISKSYKNISSDTLHSGDKVQVDITLRNTTTSTITGIKYLDTIPKIFDPSGTSKYQVELAGNVEEKSFSFLDVGDFDVSLIGRDIPAGETLHLKYQVQALPASYGEMQVGNLEKGEVGDDPYGDVGFQTSTTCGASMLIWRSTDIRAYSQDNRSYPKAQIPTAIQSQIQDAKVDPTLDADHDSIPDAVQGDALKKLQEKQTNIGPSYYNDGHIQGKIEKSGNSNNYIANIGYSPAFEKKVTNTAQKIADGLSCGFGGGGCMTFPMNWAPLAPGNDPVIFGRPVGDGAKVDEGLPIFSALTGLPTPIGCLPVVWPLSPIAFDPPLCQGALSPSPPPGPPFSITGKIPLGAGGYLGINSKTNFIRIFVTPTLTLGMGSAICMGPASVAGKIPPLGISPFLQGGNCIIITKPMNVCKGDGSAEDGDVKSVSGLGVTTDAWNGSSCQIQADTNTQKQEEKEVTDRIIDYIMHPPTVDERKTLNPIKDIYAKLAARGPRLSDATHGLLKMGGSAGSNGIGMGIDVGSARTFQSRQITKVKNTRIAGFPEFIMEWVRRQTDEITNKFLTPPNLVIIPPRNFSQNGATDKSFQNFSDTFSSQAWENSWANFEQKMGKVGSVDTAAKLQSKTRSQTGLSSGYESKLDGLIQSQASKINAISGGVNQANAAFKFLGQLPFLRVQTTRIAIHIPWILPQELDRYGRVLSQYQNELDRTMKNWCVGKTTAECADIHANAKVGALKSSIESNLQIIESYKRFPEKLQKYVTWKQRYIGQILCNVNAFEQSMGGWYKDNGIRFRKWAEFYVLVKTVAQSWQPVIDVFKQGDAQCSVCRNERGNSLEFKVKLISKFLPVLPIVQLPRWPDIILDLSDVRLGFTVQVPEFDFQISPIRLPELPLLSLPAMPSASLSLPGLPTLPAIPALPDLPDLPSFPRIQLPSLPPPPKLPKITSSLQIGVKLAKLFQKIRCYAEKTVLVPEQQAGFVIAERTARQGTLPMDFLSIQFPQYAIPTIREIRVSTHINFEKSTDFITEFARGAVKPINEWNTDIKKIQENINHVGSDINAAGAKIQNTIDDTTQPVLKNQNLDLKTNGDVLLNGQKIESSFVPDEHDITVAELSEFVDILEKEKNIELDTSEFANLLRSHMNPTDAQYLDNSMTAARLSSEELTAQMQGDFSVRMKLFYDYLDAEEAQTKEQEKMIDALRTSPIQLSQSDLPRAQFVSNTEDISQNALDQYESHISRSLASASEAIHTPSEVSTTRDTMTQSMTHLLAANDTPLVSASPAVDTSGYAPKFEGIYVLTPSGVQTKLFDYTDILDPNERVQVTDIDLDGDMDYVYLLGGVLYVKYSHMKTPDKTIDTDISFPDFDPTDMPQAPDFFHEVVASPGRIQASFAPADASHREFRLELFDRYLEWDRYHVNGRTPSEDTPRTTVDMFVEDASQIQKSETVSATPVARVLESVEKSDGFILEGMSSIVLRSGQEFTLSLGKPLYTGKNPVRISYTIASGKINELDLKPYQKYNFSENISAKILSGNAYVLALSPLDRMTYADDMIGMPLLPGTRLIHPGGVVTLYDVTLGTSEKIEKNSEYRMISLGNLSDRYTASFSYPDGLYSSRLSVVSRAHSAQVTHAGVTLLAPLASLDQSSPVVDIARTIRIPVYQTLSYDLKNIITEMSAYEVAIDADTTVDTDANGTYDDDFSLSGTGVALSKTTLNFGSFSELGIHQMQLSVTDMYGNTSLVPLQVEVYAPVPQIQSISSSGILIGNTDPLTALEPIHVFRIRSGSPLQMLFPPPILTDAEGKFATGSVFTKSGVLLSFAGNSVQLQEKSGLASSDVTTLTSHVTPATASHPMLIEFTSSDGVARSEQTLTLPDSTAFFLDPTSPEKLKVLPAVIMSSYEGTRLQGATLLDPSIPGGTYITDSGYLPLAALAKDGQIYLLDPTVSLRAIQTSEGYLEIDLIRGGKLITSIVYKVDFFYTIHDAGSL